MGKFVAARTRGRPRHHPCPQSPPPPHRCLNIGILPSSPPRGAPPPPFPPRGPPRRHRYLQSPPPQSLLACMGKFVGFLCGDPRGEQTDNSFVRRRCSRFAAHGR